MPSSANIRPGTEPHGRNYHQRNRIISGLSVASVIVEASDWRSGALITARHALDQGRDVYAVPGPIDAPQSQSCNELIAKGEAALLTSPTVLVREYSGMMPEQAVQQAVFGVRPASIRNRLPEVLGRTFAGVSSRPNSAALLPPKRRRPNPNSRLRLQNRCRTA